MKEHEPLKSTESAWQPDELFCTNHSHAERCPVCGGSGVIPCNDYVITSTTTKPCRGCGGLGWVTVRD